jgi:hypothetical protein
MYDFFGWSEVTDSLNQETIPKIWRKRKISVNEKQVVSGINNAYALTVFSSARDHLPSVGYMQQKCFFTLVGHPYWQDETLEKLALSEGNARALESAYRKYDIK